MATELQYLLSGSILLALIINANALESRAEPDPKQNIWLQMSPFPRPTYGWIKDDLKEKPKCVPTKQKDKINIYGAVTGYDFVQGNPMDSIDDPGVKARIFLHDCKFGYWDFIADVRNDLQCDSDFSMKSISSMEEYESERKSSSQMSMSASVSVGGSGFGISAAASAGYSRATNSDERASETVLSKYKGEIMMAKATCLTHAVTIADEVRPVFTTDFIHHLIKMDAAAKSSDDALKEKEVASFVREFGTHYMKEVNLGAQLVYERRFKEKAKSSSEKNDRSGCVKDEAKASVSAEGYGVKVGAGFEAKKKKCNGVKEGSAFAASEGFEGVKTISRGSRPKELKSWIDAAFTPVAIKRTLEKISNLFRDEWMTENEHYGFEKSLSGSKITKMFLDIIPNYCQIMMQGILDSNCKVVVCETANITCYNGGTCTNFNGKPRCNCAPLFSGEFCEEIKVDGSWGSWSQLEDCSVSCGGGMRVRTRSCDNPSPQNGGRYCNGDSSEASRCNEWVCEDAEDGYDIYYKKGCDGRNEIESAVHYNRRSLCRQKCDDHLGCMSFEWFGDKNPHETEGVGYCYLSATCAAGLLEKGKSSWKNIWTYVKQDYGTGWKVLQVGKTCKSSHVEMSKAHNAGECANSVRNAGGTFFEFSQEVDGTGKCWWEQTTSADCVEGWETGKSYDFYSLTECVPYGEQACYEASKKMNKKFSVSDYTIKGCYGYTTGTYSDTLWYGTGGKLDDRKAAVGGDQFRPKEIDCAAPIVPQCVPYGEEACRQASKNKKKAFKMGGYGTKGCYTYSKGSYSGTFWFGTGGDLDARKAAVGGGKLRPPGYDCK